MAKDDLFNDEENMVRMTFGEHLEDLRRRLILSLIMVIPFVAIGLYFGDWLVKEMSRPVKNALTKYYDRRRDEKLTNLDNARAELKMLEETRGDPKKLQEARDAIKRDTIRLHVDRDSLREAIRQAFPELKIPDAASEQNVESGQVTAPSPEKSETKATKTAHRSGPARSSPQLHPSIEIVAEVDHDELQVAAEDEYNRSAFITLGPQEGFMAYLKVSVVAGIVMSSWWIIYQLWQFVAEGLYKHERRIVYRAMPMSVGLFLVGVVFCFFIVLPVVLNFFFSINEWLKIEPNIRLSEWLGFATILPLVFGICFELPLVMLVLESIGIFRVDDYVAKWRHAILIISIVAMVVTPTTDPGSMMLLMGPMGGLYFLGIGLVQMRRGGLRALSPTAKLRAAVGILITMYLIGVSVGFAFPDGWLPPEYWLENVWKPGTLPTSWLLRIFLKDPNPNWMWGVTFGNAFVLGLAVLRIGELILRVARRRKP